MKWYIQISGKEECLEWLLKTLKDQDPTVVKEDDGTYGLCSSSLDDLEEKEVRVKAEALIKKLNVLCSIKTACTEGINFSTLYYFDEKDIKRAFVLSSTTVLVSASSVSATLSGGQEIDLEAELIIKYLPFLHSDDETISHVFDLFLYDNRTYQAIYNILDGIIEDLGSEQEVIKKLDPARDIKRLKGSVDNLATVGIEHARHGKKGTKIKNPMYLPEARALINSIFWKWVELKFDDIKDDQKL